jgi:hypothetical protein
MDLVVLKQGDVMEVYTEHRNSRQVLRLPFAKHAFHSFGHPTHLRSLAACQHLKEEGGSRQPLYVSLLL